MASRQEVLRANLKEWLACKGDRIKRGELTRRLSKSLKMNPKSIGRSMRRLQVKSKTKTEDRGRPEQYGADVTAALLTVWEAMEYPCAENMTREAIDEYLKHFMRERAWRHRDATTDALLAMSEATKKRRIAELRKKRGMLRGRSATVSSPLKGMIPIRKSHTWSDLPPGYLQTDTVVHYGDRLTDDVVYSLGCVDFASYWSEYTAQWNKGEEATQESLATLRERFVFPWKEIHPDTGNEFINYHVHRWATEEKIEMTRSEPYKKNDNMCIEERNNSIARRHLGYVRLDDPTFAVLAREILRIACLIHNHFRPVRRLVSKVRIGAKWKRALEKKAKTPYQRILERSDVARKIKQELRLVHENLNPLALKKQLDTLKDELAKKLDYSRKKKNADR
jgi:hypothetical protein